MVYRAGAAATTPFGHTIVARRVSEMGLTGVDGISVIEGPDGAGCFARAIIARQAGLLASNRRDRFWDQQRPTE